VDVRSISGKYHLRADPDFLRKSNEFVSIWTVPHEQQAHVAPPRDPDKGPQQNRIAFEPVQPSDPHDQKVR
jgi:hypothetical protein